MIRLTLRGHDAHGVGFYSDESTLDSVHKSLWGVLSVTLDERALVRLWDCQIHDRAIFAFFMYRIKGAWCFQDGTPFKGPVLRVYWRVRSRKGQGVFEWDYQRLNEARACADVSRADGHEGIKITRVTVRLKARAR